jgi:hypothetical protein
MKKRAIPNRYPKEALFLRRRLQVGRWLERHARRPAANRGLGDITD